MQPIEFDDHGTVRFKPNQIVVYLLDRASEIHVDMNHLALLDFSQEDREQFAQLIGYSVSGFGDLSYASGEVIAKADAEAESLIRRQ